MKWLDAFLNRITMYRLVLYVLIVWVGVAVLLSFAGLLPYDGVAVLLSTLFLVAVAWMTNAVFSHVYGAPRHDDSAYITALILALILPPLRTSADLGLLVWAPILAMAGKYILAFRKQHIFNPAALAVAITAFTIGASATWWIGNLPMLPAVLVGGYLIARKIRRWSVVLTFLAVAIITAAALGLQRGMPIFTSLHRTLVASPLFFFAFVMLTEPLTMPPTKVFRVMYAAMVGLFFAPQIHFGALYSTPELALLAGNFVFFLFIRRGRYILRLREKVLIAPGITDFVFDGPRFAFQPGQYMEWTLPHEKVDSRGVRRYFTIASAPSENAVRLGVKFYGNPSSFKKELAALKPGASIVAGQQDGDFTLPRDPKKKCVFIAGGIGVTPFRSMLMDFLEKNERRPITMFYACNAASDFVYHELFDQAERQLGIRTLYILGDTKNVPPQWHGKVGYVTPEMIQAEVPDWQKRRFYISGPNAMVVYYETVLARLGVKRGNIKKDYFPGFA